MPKANLTEQDLDRIWALMPYALWRKEDAAKRRGKPGVTRPSHLAEAFANAAAMYVDCRMAIRDGFADNKRGCRVVDGPRGLSVELYDEQDTAEAELLDHDMVVQDELIEDDDTWDASFHGPPPGR
ncbi:MAG: hypothetical protein KTR31_23545 [Myxococcales bacterium]|nr:hypothetical protein [Myxococcales bacterium]